MEKKNDISLRVDEILIRLLLKKLGYDEKIIAKVCEIIE